MQTDALLLAKVYSEDCYSSNFVMLHVAPLAQPAACCCALLGVVAFVYIHVA